MKTSTTRSTTCLWQSALLFCALVLVIVTHSHTASAGVILTRTALNSAVPNLSAENFENFTGVVLTVVAPNRFSLLDKTTVVNGQGPDIVGDGLRFFSQNINPELAQLQLDRDSQYQLSSAAIVATGTLVIDFLAPVTHTGFDLFQFNGFADTAVVKVYAADDTTLLYTSGLLAAPNAPSSTFFGYSDLGGIGRITLTSSTRSFSPLVDNLSYAAVPEPSALVLGAMAVGLIGAARYRRRRHLG